MTHYSRKDWGARPPRGGPGSLTPSLVDGIALHWPAMSSPLRTVEQVKAALRGWQNYHMDGRGYSDIAYQVAVDQAGNRYELRGLATQSGANGDEVVNERYGAVLLILASGEEPSPEMVAEVRHVIADHRRMFPRSKRIVGHGDIRSEPTACPGPAATRLIRAGAFEPTTTPTQSEEDDDMAFLDEPLNVHDPKGRAETQGVTGRELLVALAIFLGNQPGPHQAYLEGARKSPAKEK